MPLFGSVNDGLDNAMMESFWSSMQIELLNRESIWVVPGSSEVTALYVLRMDLMDVSDIPFVFGVLVAPMIVVGVFTTIIATRQSKSVMALTSVLSAIVVGALGAYWVLWGAAFDEADAGRPVSSAVDRTMSIAIDLSAVSGALLLALSAALLISRSRSGRHLVGAR